MISCKSPRSNLSQSSLYDVTRTLLLIRKSKATRCENKCTNKVDLCCCNVWLLQRSEEALAGLGVSALQWYSGYVTLYNLQSRVNNEQCRTLKHMKTTMSSHKAYTDTQTHNVVYKPYLKNRQFSRFQCRAAVHFHSSFLFRVYSLHLLIQM